jgi:hypothetical protein
MNAQFIAAMVDLRARKGDTKAMATHAALGLLLMLIKVDAQEDYLEMVFALMEAGEVDEDDVVKLREAMTADIQADVAIAKAMAN